MLQWLWEHGDKRQIARSIPQLDPQKLRALVDEKDGEIESGHMDTGGFTESQVQDDDFSIRIAREAFAVGEIARGMYEALVAFQIFRPSLHQDKPSNSHAGVGHQKWHISFLVCNLVATLAGGKTAEHLLRSPRFAAFVSSLVRKRVWLISMRSATPSNHCN